VVGKRAAPPSRRNRIMSAACCRKHALTGAGCAAHKAATGRVWTALRKSSTALKEAGVAFEIHPRCDGGIFAARRAIDPLNAAADARAAVHHRPRNRGFAGRLNMAGAGRPPSKPRSSILGPPHPLRVSPRELIEAGLPGSTPALLARAGIRPPIKS